MWKDTTSYSRGDKERIPTTFTVTVDELSITITCGHIRYRPDWVMHCFNLGIDTLPMPSCENLDEAKRRAVAIVKHKLSRLTEAVNEIII